MRKLVATLVALLTIAVLGGCSDEPMPRRTRPTATPVTPTVTDSQAIESMSQFLDRWVAANNEMQLSGRTDTYESLHQGCRACRELSDFVHDVYANGGSIETSGSRVERLDVLGRSKGVTVVEFDLVSGPTDYRESRTGALKHLRGGRERVQVNLIESDESWKITRLSRLPA